MSITKKLQTISKSLESKRIEIDASKNHAELIKQVEKQNQALEMVVSQLKQLQTAFKEIDYPKPHKEIKVSNLGEIKPAPTTVSVKKPSWFKLKQFSLSELLEGLRNLLSRDFKVDMDKYRSAKNALAVRISDGRSFAEALGAGMAGGMKDVVFPDIQVVDEPLPTLGNNPDLTLEYTDGVLTKLTKTINDVDYESTLTYEDGVLTEVSRWTQT